MIRNELKTLIFEAIGEASMCWSETPSGVFDSIRAANIADRILFVLDQYRKKQLQTLIENHMKAMRPLIDEWSK